MPTIELIDTSVRDGQQSLWATRMTNEMIFPSLPLTDAMGYAYIDLVGGAVFDVCVRYLHEDPWERMRLASRLATTTPLNVWTRGQSLFTFEMFADDIVELTVRRVAANGIRRYTCYDTLHDIRNIAGSVHAAKACGIAVAGHVVYTLSPVHTDEYYAAKAREIVALGVDFLGIKDPSGLLTPERARTLVPALRAVAGDTPLELHTHCRGGLGELVVIEAVALGVQVVHVGTRPLASADALPDARYVVGRLRAAGWDVRVAEHRIREMEAHFTAVAERFGKPVRPPNRHDPFLYQHQVPGGMISNLRSQLRDMGMEDRLEAILEELPQVRRDLGYPILVSPFAQFVVTQATLNVVQGERYATMPDEVVRYVLGHYGALAAPVAAEVRERVDAIAGGREPIAVRPGEAIPPRVPALRRELGPHVSDDDLLLAAFYQPSTLEPLMRARRSASPPAMPSVRLPLREIFARMEALPRGRHARIAEPAMAIEGTRA